MKQDIRPLAFMSHSSADKDRVVRPMDELLRQRGVRTWLDERDMLPGMNIVDAIFESGISGSDAFVCFITPQSVESKWVHEELSVAVVQRIAGVVKVIIPVVLDGAQPPAALAATVWETVASLQDLPRHADRIAASIYGRAVEAPTAPTPEYAGVPIHHIRGTTPNDERVLVAACEQLLALPEYYPMVSFFQLFASARTVGLSEEQVAESVAALQNANMFSDLKYQGGMAHPIFGRITYWGFEEYLKAYKSAIYLAAKKAVAFAIVNQGLNEQRVIAQTLGIHELIVAHILNGLEQARHIRLAQHMGGAIIMALPTMPRVMDQFS